VFIISYSYHLNYHRGYHLSVASATFRIIVSAITTTFDISINTVMKLSPLPLHYLNCYYHHHSVATDVSTSTTSVSAKIVVATTITFTIDAITINFLIHATITIIAIDANTISNLATAYVVVIATSPSPFKSPSVPIATTTFILACWQLYHY